MIYEPRNRIEVITPKGNGAILFVTDYGYETDTIYTVVLDDSGELWQFTHKDLKIRKNITFGRTLNK